MDILKLGLVSTKESWKEVLTDNGLKINAHGKSRTSVNNGKPVANETEWTRTEQC